MSIYHIIFIVMCENFKAFNCHSIKISRIKVMLLYIFHNKNEFFKIQCIHNLYYYSYNIDQEEIFISGEVVKLE